MTSLTPAATLKRIRYRLLSLEGRQLMNAFAMAATLCAVATSASAASVSYRFDDGSAAALAGQVSATVVAGGVPMVVTAGAGNFTPGGSEARLAATLPGYIADLPLVAGLGIASQHDTGGTAGIGVDRAETLQMSFDPSFRLESVTLRTFGTVQGFLVYTHPYPGATRSVLNQSMQEISSFYPGTSDITTLSFESGVERVGITPFDGARQPAFILIAVTGSIVPEPTSFATLTSLMLCLVNRRPNN